MSAETLRRAAALMREQAESACEVGAPWHSVADLDTFDAEDARHIASWHPAVALAVAEVLTFAAETWSDDRCSSSRGWDETCGECVNCSRHWAQVRALAVARAYLGEP